MTKKIGILGGAFNPIHIGHIEIAKAVLEHLNFDEIWFLVSYNPPHKELIDANDFNHRCNMVKLAIENDDKFILKDLEYKLYNDKIFDINSSYNVMSYITKEYPYYDFSLIIGYDELLDIESWKNYKELLNNYKFIIVKRQNYILNKSFIDKLINDYNLKYDLLDINITDCSSTDIRNNINDDKYTKYLSDNVWKYIKDNRLY